MPNYTVNSTIALIAAVSKAKSGDTILVASGTYSNINLSNIKIAGNVTITSADAAAPAVFTDVLVRGSSGMTFQNLEFAAKAGAMYPFQVSSSSNIVLDHLNVHGTLNGNVNDDGIPMMVRLSTNVTVSNSEFQQAQNGLAFLDNDGLKIVNNSFHDLRTDGVAGGGTSNLVVSNNYFTNFFPQWGDPAAGKAGDHPDAIQLWTAGTTKNASNIVITDNLVVRGDGDPVQGIFLRDQSDSLPFQNVVVTGNTVIGGIGNGIGIDGVDKLVVANNVVQAVEGQSSHIVLSKVSAATMTGNQSTGFMIQDAVDVVKSDNILLDSLVGSGARTLAAKLAGAVNATGYARLADTLVAAAAVKLGYMDDPSIGAARQSFAQVQIAGTAGDDRLAAAKVGDSRVEGGDGNDLITGGSQGFHDLVGGRGDDNYTVKIAGDTVIEAAGQGTDTVNAYIDYTLTANVETLRLVGSGLTGTGNDLDNRIVGSAGDDTLYGLGGADMIQGGVGDDAIWGGSGNDDLRGEAGDDVIHGDDGADTLSGGDGDDHLFGGAGNDVVEGGAGNDVLQGDAGADIFRFRPADIAGGSTDRIVDFARGQDKIDLSAIDAKAGTAANDAFAFIGASGFHKVAGELRYEVKGGDAYVYGDVNGDGVADFTIVASHTGVLTAGDFAL